MLTETDAWVIANNVHGDNSPASHRMNAILIRTYGQAAIDAILLARKDYRKSILVNQQNWRTRVSRRAQRNVHHDSWAIRENYVRQGNGYRDYYSLGHDLIRQAIANGARTNIYPQEMRWLNK